MFYVNLIIIEAAVRNRLFTESNKLGFAKETKLKLFVEIIKYFITKLFEIKK